MPRPLKYTNAQKVREGIAEKYLTRSFEIPPSPCIPSIAIDEGNTIPKYMRPTVINAPQDQSMQTISQIPFGFVVQPLAEIGQQEYNQGVEELPVIDSGEEGPFRCFRCKSYVNPYMSFVDHGNKAICNICGFAN